MVNELKTIKVTILGKNYNLSTDDDELDIAESVGIIDKRMNEIVNAMPVKDGYMAAVLLSLELVGEIKKQEQCLSSLQKKALDLSSLLASKLA